MNCPYLYRKVMLASHHPHGGGVNIQSSLLLRFEYNVPVCTLMKVKLGQSVNNSFFFFFLLLEIE